MAGCDMNAPSSTLLAVLSETETPQIIVDAASSKKVLLANPAWCALMGFSSEDVIGLSVAILKGPLTCQGTWSALILAMAGGHSLSVMVVSYRKNGEPFLNAIDISPLFDSQGKPTFYKWTMNAQRTLTAAEMEVAPTPAADTGEVETGQKKARKLTGERSGSSEQERAAQSDAMTGANDAYLHPDFLNFPTVSSEKRADYAQVQLPTQLPAQLPAQLSGRMHAAHHGVSVCLEGGCAPFQHLAACNTNLLTCHKGEVDSEEGGSSGASNPFEQLANPSCGVDGAVKHVPFARTRCALGPAASSASAATAPVAAAVPAEAPLYFAPPSVCTAPTASAPCAGAMANVCACTPSPLPTSASNAAAAVPFLTAPVPPSTATAAASPFAAGLGASGGGLGASVMDAISGRGPADRLPLCARDMGLSSREISLLASEVGLPDSILANQLCAASGSSAKGASYYAPNALNRVVTHRTMSQAQAVHFAAASPSLPLAVALPTTHLKMPQLPHALGQRALGAPVLPVAAGDVRGVPVAGFQPRAAEMVVGAESAEVCVRPSKALKSNSQQGPGEFAVANVRTAGSTSGSACGSGSSAATTTRRAVPFVLKLWEMVNELETNRCICWSQDGRSFWIIDAEALETYVLPRYFKHNRSSFLIKQLRTYGFQHMRGLSCLDQAKEWIHTKAYFLRSDESLLPLIQRVTSRAGALPAPAVPQRAAGSADGKGDRVMEVRRCTCANVQTVASESLAAAYDQQQQSASSSSRHHHQQSGQQQLSQRQQQSRQLQQGGRAGSSSCGAGNSSCGASSSCGRSARSCNSSGATQSVGSSLASRHERSREKRSRDRSDRPRDRSDRPRDRSKRHSNEACASSAGGGGDGSGGNGGSNVAEPAPGAAGSSACGNAAGGTSEGAGDAAGGDTSGGSSGAGCGARYEATSGDTAHVIATCESGVACEGSGCANETMTSCNSSRDTLRDTSREGSHEGSREGSDGGSNSNYNQREGFSSNDGDSCDDSADIGDNGSNSSYNGANGSSSSGHTKPLTTSDGSGNGSAGSDARSEEGSEECASSVVSFSEVQTNLIQLNETMERQRRAMQDHRCFVLNQIQNIMERLQRYSPDRGGPPRRSDVPASQ